MQNILLAVVGLTPQVLTETLYYYTQVADPPVAFDEIRVLTTAEGKQKLIETLLDPKNGRFHQFCRDYSIVGIRFDETCIEVIAGLSDIRSVSDNGMMAAHVLAAVKRLAAEPDTALYCSIAGGRKTMGAYIALALQLYGRPQDRLSHVLVSPEFESHPDFYYPPPQDHIIMRRDTDGKEVLLHTKDVKIELADIPFVSVRNLLPRRGDYPIEELVRRLQASIEGKKPLTSIRIELRRKKIWVNDAAVSMPPKELSVYAFFAHTKKKCRKKKCVGCQECYLSMNEIIDRAEEIFAWHGKIVVGHSGKTEQLRKNWDKSRAEERDQYFLETFSKINKRLRMSVPELYPFVEIAGQGVYGKKYGIPLDGRAIELEE